jgi:molecular chaperone HtpG
VNLSGRLKDSACCLVGDEGAMDPQMEKMLRAMGQEVPETKRIMEINPGHPLFEKMVGIFEKDRKDPVLDEYATLLYDQALILEGSKPKDAAAFAKMMTRLMVDDAEKRSS